MNKSSKIFGVMLLAASGLSFAEDSALAATKVSPSATIATHNPSAGFGIIRGFVRDETGAPIAGALIALFRDGVATVRQLKSAPDGSFVARVAAGRYSVTAMAEGFSVVSLANVEIDRAEDLAFRFNLVRMGSGNTVPERRADRNQPKWRARSNNSRRTIYQNTEGTGETTASVEKIETVENSSEDSNSSRRGQTAVETYFASSATGANFVGLNFATVQPLNENFDFVIAGQTGVGQGALQRLEAGGKFKLNNRHQINFKVGGAQLGKVSVDDKTESELGQLSFQVVDEWRLRDGVILVLGMDYAQFVNAGKAISIAPRLGLQFDANAKTRFSTALTTQHESNSWSQAADLEEARVLFRAPTPASDYAVVDKRALLPRMRRLEFGLERVLDNSSSFEATVFFDDISNRAVSFVNLPLTGFDDGADANDFADKLFVGAQNGSAQGVRIVYSRRLNNILSASAGYAAGRGQSLSNKFATNPAGLFEDDFFQTVTAQFNADLGNGTQIRTVWRYSPRATVFAIDPFAGRMAYYEPSLSVLLTQKLPTWGLPLRARAMLDARNLFDLQTETINGEQSLRVNNNRRFLRGGIAVRF